MAEPAAAAAIAGAADLRQRAAGVCARAGVVSLFTHRPRDGAAGGAHLGTRRGGGVEFAEHRDYSPGDDLRHLDWRAFARRDRLLVKRFEAEVHTDVWLVIDGSASMTYAEDGADGVDKLDAVRLLAAAIATVAVAGGDAVGLEVPGQRHLPPRGGKPSLHRLVEALAGVAASGAPGLEAVGERAAMRGPATWVVFSDVLADPALALAPLAAAVRAGAEITLVHALHPRELDFAFPDEVQVRCDETGAVLHYDPRRLQEQASAWMAQHCDDVRQAALRAGVRYLLLDLATDAAAALRAILRAVGQGRRRG